MIGRSVCYNHGGKTPRGMASPHTVIGKFSRDIPTRMAARYQKARNDPELLALRDEVGLIDARLIDVLKRVDTGESETLWRHAQECWQDLLAARMNGDAQETSAALNALGEAIGRGHGDWAAWADVRKLLQERRALVESERKRLVEMQQLITAEQAMMFMAAVVAAVQRHVTDRDTLASITTEFERLTTRDVHPAHADRRVPGPATAVGE